MNKDKPFTISDFAKLSRTSRKTLLHYDKIALLSPISRGDNKYRYYSIGQLAVVNLIRTLQKLGMSLDRIRELKDRRTPENTSELLTNQLEHINMKIEEWTRAKKLLISVKRNIDNAIRVDENSLTIRSMNAKAIVQGELIDYGNGVNEYEALIDFYSFVNKKYPNIDTNYPVWAIFSKSRVLSRDWQRPDRYYLNNPDGFDRKPSGLYAIGYARGGYGNSDELYVRLLEYIDDNNYEICGNTYEEYPLNELCVSDENNYLIRLMLTVRKKDGKSRFNQFIG